MNHRKFIKKTFFSSLFLLAIPFDSQRKEEAKEWNKKRTYWSAECFIATVCQTSICREGNWGEEKKSWKLKWWSNSFEESLVNRSQYFLALEINATAVLKSFDSFPSTLPFSRSLFQLIFFLFVLSFHSFIVLFSICIIQKLSSWKERWWMER